MFLVLLFFKSCKKIYDDFEFERCRVSQDGTSWEVEADIQSLGIYLHAKSKSSLKVISNYSNESEIKPGEAYFFDENATAKCTGNDCDISFWFTNVTVPSGSIIADSTGTSFSFDKDGLEEKYFSFFDFGENSRILVQDLMHPRQKALHFWTTMTNTSNNTFLDTILTNDTYPFNFTRPAMIQISEAPYNHVKFTIIAGSSIKNSPEFAQNKQVVYWKNLDYSKNDTYAMPSVQFNADIVKYAMNGLTAFGFLCSILQTIIMPIIKKTKKTRPVSEQNASLLEDN